MSANVSNVLANVSNVVADVAFDGSLCLGVTGPRELLTFVTSART
jgi:hypothetical protein